MFKKKDKVEKVKKTKDQEKTFNFWFKRLFFGVGKEFSRISWTKKEKVFKDFFVIIILCLIIALVFLGVDKIFLSLLPELNKK